MPIPNAKANSMGLLRERICVSAGPDLETPVRIACYTGLLFDHGSKKTGRMQPPAALVLFISTLILTIVLLTFSRTFSQIFDTSRHGNLPKNADAIDILSNVSSPAVVAELGERKGCSNLKFSEREDCGYSGIEEQECRERRCCWSRLAPPWTPWCFYEKGGIYTCESDPVSRLDCGYLGIDESECLSKNCCWDPHPDVLNSPWCYFKRQRCQGYGVISSTVDTRDDGFTAELALVGEQGCANYGDDIKRVRVEASFESGERARVRILGAHKDQRRYEVPQEALPDPPKSDRSDAPNTSPLYRFTYTQNPFTFAIVRTSDDTAIFNTSVPEMDSLIFEDQYLEISTRLPKDASIYGLGESVGAFLRDIRGTRQTMWTRDAALPVNENVYGSHPFYLEMRNGTAHGVFLRNSNGMDVVLTPGKLTYKVIGGIFDFYIFLGPMPHDVMRQYTEVIGRPHMPPAWAIGFHQSRYGYKDISEVEDMVQTFRDKEIPLDTIWLDIDYMDNFKDFTFDPVNFPLERVRALSKDLHDHDQRLVVIVDPGIANLPDYDPYVTGVASDVFMKNAAGEDIVGKVWPGETVFPDWFNQNETWAWWQELIRGLVNDIGVDGLWIDMNEPASWCNGECVQEDPEDRWLGDREDGPQRPQRPLQYPAADDRGADFELLKRNLSSPPYPINNGGNRSPLNSTTLSMDAKHRNGLLMYDTHNLYGHMESIATRQALLNISPGKRPFVLTRSTFAGTGAHAGHWTGDNWAEWTHLYFSIPGIMNFQLFGIPLVGADICGFIGNTSEELCLRWHQLGSLYPFARNHNAKFAAPQEPYRWPAVLHSARQSLLTRYTLLPYLYTLFRAAHLHGSPVWQPLFFSFPDDTTTLAIDRQVMLGDKLLISPVLHRGQVQVKAYFPGSGRWFNFWSYKRVMEQDVVDDGGKGQQHDATSRYRPHRYAYVVSHPTDPIPLHLHGGSIVPLQYPGLTVAVTRKNAYFLYVALDARGNAVGTMYWDDGESLDSSSERLEVSWEVRDGTSMVAKVLEKEGVGEDGARVGGKLERVVIMGIERGRNDDDDETRKPIRGIESLRINGTPVDEDGARWELNEEAGTLVLEELKLEMTKDWAIKWEWTY